jgi:hypothetical protein
MAPRLGQYLYLAGYHYRGVLVAWVVWGYIYDMERGEPIVRIVPLLLAGVIWLAGWVCRKVFAER